jgi:predicted enzyme related to lactoylglutathione lyase
VVALACLLGADGAIDLPLVVLAGLAEHGQHHDRAIWPAPVRYPDRHLGKPNPQLPDLAFQVIGPMEAMICPLLTYRDIQRAMAELHDLFDLEVVWLADDAAEIRWNGGVAVAQADQPEMLHGSHVGHGWTYVRVADPDAHYDRVVSRGADVLNEPHEGPRRPVRIQRQGPGGKHLDLRHPRVRPLAAQTCRVVRAPDNEDRCASAQRAVTGAGAAIWVKNILK